MDNFIDKGWFKWLAFGIIIGFFVGKLLSMLIEMLVIPSVWTSALIAICEPAMMIFAIIIVIAAYQKEKENTIE